MLLVFFVSFQAKPAATVSVCVCLMAIVVALSHSISSSLKPIEALDKSCWQDSKRTFITELHIYFVVYFHLRFFFSPFALSPPLIHCVWLLFRLHSDGFRIQTLQASKQKGSGISCSPKNTRNITARKMHHANTHTTHIVTATQPQSCKAAER